MDVKILKEKINYKGYQLAPLYNYLNYGVLGTSLVIGAGACDISFEHMVDGEDVLQKSEIRSQEMVHLLIESFEMDLTGAVGFQRLLSDLCIRTVCSLSNQVTQEQFDRCGDDIYFQKEHKLNISIATKSPNSTLIHYGVNITNEKTPVKTASLSDFAISTNEFMKEFSQLVQGEYKSIIRATQKVKPLV